MRTKTTLLALLVSLLFINPACSSKTSKPDAVSNEAVVNLRGSEALHKGAVLAGDFPDPSVIRVDKTYWAVATTSEWAPAFSLMTSDDLANWKVVGSVFATQPDWADGNYWAPEISKVGSTYFVYYAAKGKLHGRMCVGVATSSKPQGPYEDRGPLICQAVGSIDPDSVVDEQGKRFLFWKEDGNSQQKPTPIWVQQLSNDGLKLVGKPVEAIRNDAPWEAQLVEAPFVFKHGDYWYMFYAGNACCTAKCDYKVGVARSKNLLGPWEKNPSNPIISSNEAWKCPGHGSVVEDTSGRDVFMYHGYNAKDSTFVGRQALADVVVWDVNNWPTINNGLGPSDHKNGFLGLPIRNEELKFSDDFSTSKLQPGWQWPHEDQPRITLKNGALILSGPGESGDPMKAVFARSTSSSDYIAETKILTGKMKSESFAGIAAVGNSSNAVGASYSGGKIYLWNKISDRLNIISSADVPKSDSILVRLTTRLGYLFKFEYSADGKTWTALTNELNGQELPPWDLGIRVALVSGGPTGSQAIFESFSMRAYQGSD